MTAPPHTEHEEGRPVHQAASASSTILGTTVRRGSDSRLDLVHVEGVVGEVCAECAGRLGKPKPGRTMCPQCHLDHLAALRRRRELEWRLPPLTDLRAAS